MPHRFLPLLFYLQLVRTDHQEDVDGQDPGGDVDEHAGEVEADEGHHDVDQPQDEPDPTPNYPRLHQTDFLLGKWNPIIQIFLRHVVNLSSAMYEECGNDNLKSAAYDQDLSKNEYCWKE